MKWESHQLQAWVLINFWLRLKPTALCSLLEKNRTTKKRPHPWRKSILSTLGAYLMCSYTLVHSSGQSLPSMLSCITCLNSWEMSTVLILTSKQISRPWTIQELLSVHSRWELFLIWLGVSVLPWPCSQSLLQQRSSTQWLLPTSRLIIGSLSFISSSLVSSCREWTTLFHQYVVQILVDLAAEPRTWQVQSQESLMEREA